MKNRITRFLLTSLIGVALLCSVIRSPPCPPRRWGIPPTWPHQWHFPCGSSCSTLDMGDRAQELFQRVKADYAKTAQAIQTFREEAGG